VLQVAEIAVAFVFVDVAVHLTSQGSLLAGAAVLALLALTARGALGIVRLCPRPLHVVLVVVASAAIALSPILPVLRPDLTGILVAEFGAIGLIRLATLTRTLEPIAARAGASVGPSATATSATATAEPEQSSEPAAQAGSLEATGPGGEERDLSVVEKSARTAAAATVAGRAAAERYGPVAEEQARRAVRSAGRSVGRMLRRTSPPVDPPG
jgi:hypothetical protein